MRRLISGQPEGDVLLAHVKGEGWHNKRVRVVIGEAWIDLDANGVRALRAALKAMQNNQNAGIEIRIDHVPLDGEQK